MFVTKIDKNSKVVEVRNSILSRAQNLNSTMNAARGLKHPIY